MIDFYIRWIKTTFRHSIGLIDLWTGLGAAMLGLADHYLPHAQLMTNYGWKIFIWALAAVIIVRLILAPYWIFDEDRKQISALKKLIDDKEEEKQRKIEALWALRKDGVKLRNAQIIESEVDSWKQKFDQWRDSILTEARGLSISLVNSLETLNEVRPTPARSVPYASRVHARYVPILSELIRRLEEFLNKQS